MKVNYRDKIYNVTNPGEILTDERGYILDQLDENLPKVGRYRGPYLFSKYGLTEFDYYIIVVFGGDFEKLPKCEFEGCDKYKQFNHLLNTKKEPIFELGCCKEHTRILINRISGRRLIEEGRSPIIKALSSPMTDERRMRHHNAALKQVKEGRHPWQSLNRSKKILEAQNTLKNNLLEKGLEYKTAFNSLDEVLLNDKITFENRGDKSDKCYLYITYLDNRPDVIKIGVTINIEVRKHAKYHNSRYINTKVLYESTRDIISNLEYSIKKNFMKDIVLGTETFPINLKDSILEFIKEQINIIESSSTTIAESIHNE